jgi:hypothetical protein
VIAVIAVIGAPSPKSEFLVARIFDTDPITAITGDVGHLPGSSVPW